MTVENIQLIKKSKKPGIYIQSGTIGIIQDVGVNMKVSPKGMVTEIDTGCGCKNCKIVIKNVGAIGVLKQETTKKRKKETDEKLVDLLD